MTNPKLGVDLAGLDLRATPQGDLALMDDIQNVRASIWRRLETPVGGLFAHPQYGNPLYDILSDSIDDVWEAKAQAGIRQCLDQEPRISLTQVEVGIDLENRKAVFGIYYVMLGIPRADNIVWEAGLTA